MDKFILDNSEQVIAKVSGSIMSIAKRCITTHGRFTIALSGGSTPKLLYTKLIKDNLFKSIDTSKVFVYFSDERYVPLDDQRSNYGLAMDNLFNFLDVPTENIFPVDTTFEKITDSAIDYQNIISKNINSNADNIPEFDLIILGMGADGHTASLFPGSSLVTEHHDLVASCFHEESNTDRISFTFPLINASKNIILITLGIEKFKVLTEIKQLSKANEIKFPVQYVNPMGNFMWFSDELAENGVTRN